MHSRNRLNRTQKCDLPIWRVGFGLLFVPGIYLVFGFILIFATLFLLACISEIASPSHIHNSGATTVRLLLIAGGSVVAISATLRSFQHMLTGNYITLMGTEVRLEDELEFAQMVAAICTALHVRLPTHIILRADIGNKPLMVHQGKMLVITEPDGAQGTVAKRLKGRTLVVSLPLLNLLTAEELRALLTHELAHFAGIDALYCLYVQPVYAGIRTFETSTERLRNTNGWFASFGMNGASKVAFFLLKWYRKVFSNVNRRIQYAMEYRADAAAVDLCGAQIMTSALLEVYRGSSAFNNFEKAHHVYIDEDINYYASFRAVQQASNTVPSQVQERMSITDQDDDEHPSLHLRLQAIKEYQKADAFAADPSSTNFTLARNLFQGAEEYEQRLTRTYAHPPENTDDADVLLQRHHYAGIGRRMAAGCIDSIVVFFLLAPFSSPPRALHLTVSQGQKLWITALYGVPILYVALMESLPCQGTVGKLIAGLYVCDLQNRRLPWWRIVLRSVLAFLFMFPGFGIPYLTAAFTIRRQTLHDMILHTVVCKKTRARSKKIRRATYSRLLLRRRALAGLLDSLLLWLLTGYIALGAQWLGVKESLQSVVFIVALPTGVFLYFGFMESSPWQATLGKMAMRLHVTDLNEERLSFWRAGLRGVIGLASAYLLFGLPYMLIVFTQEGRTFSDFIFQTRVGPLPGESFAMTSAQRRQRTDDWKYVQRRINANLIDVIAVFICYAGAGVAMSGILYISSKIHPVIRILALFLGQSVLIFIPVLYVAGMESSSWQATLGKRAVGLKITDLEGSRLNFWRAAGHSLLGALVCGLSFGLLFLMAGITPRKQALHDLLFRCMVLSTTN